LIGDRSIDKDKFGKIQIERTNEKKKLSNILKDIDSNEKFIKTAIVSVNNHYTGFGHTTTKMFAHFTKNVNKDLSQ